MWLCFRLKNTSSVEFLIPRKKITDGKLLGFHLSLPMGYMDSVPYFYMSTDTIADIKNYSVDGHHMDPPHPLKLLDDAPALTERDPEQDGNG